MTVVVRAYNSNIRGEARLELIFKECTLKFRRTADYDGSFGFDWLREGDTDDGEKNPAYESIMSGDEYSKLLKEYDYFDQPWRKRFTKYAPKERYYIPWMTIMPGVTAPLRIRLEVGRPSGEIKLKVTGGAASVITLSQQTIPASRKGTYDYGTLNVTCNGTFSGQGAIEAWNHGELVGKVLIEPNNQVKHVKIALIHCVLQKWKSAFINGKSTYIADGFSRGVLKGGGEERLKKLLQQAYVIPEFYPRPNVDLDLTQPLAEERMISGSIGSLFDSYFRTEESRRINPRKENINELEKTGAGMNIWQYLNYRLQTDQKKYDWNNLYKVFLFDEIGTSNGTSLKNNKSSFIFKDYLDGNSSTTTHEVAHLLSVPHTFDDKGYNDEPEDKPIYIMTGGKTENIMDYREDTDKGSEHRISFSHYQMKRIWSHLSQQK